MTARPRPDTAAVEDARMAYGYWANWQRLALAAHLRGIGRPPDVCTVCPKVSRHLDAFSIAYDNAVSLAHPSPRGVHPKLTTQPSTPLTGPRQGSGAARVESDDKEGTAMQRAGESPATDGRGAGDMGLAPRARLTTDTHEKNARR